jgi:hypothetical protein
VELIECLIAWIDLLEAGGGGPGTFTISLGKERLCQIL